MKKIIRGIVVILLAIQVITFSACSSKSGASVSKSHAADYGGALGLTDNTAEKSAAKSETADKTGTSSSTNLTAASSRKIVKSADISLTTVTYDKSVAALENTVENCGGYVQSSATQGEGASDSRTASFTVRVPTARFDDFLDSVGKAGKVVNRSVNGEDVTQNYLDTETRLSALKTEHARLLELLDKAAKMSDILEIEQKLSDIESDMEQYTGELKKWDSLVDLSTVNINISEAAKDAIAVQDTFSGKVSGIFTKSVNALVTTVKFICYFIVAILPFAVIIGIVAFIIIFIKRRRKKNENQKTLDEHIVDNEGNNEK